MTWLTELLADELPPVTEELQSQSEMFLKNLPPNASQRQRDVKLQSSFLEEKDS